MTVRAPMLEETQSPVNELKKLPVVTIVISPERSLVATSQEVTPLSRPIIGEDMAVNVEVRGQRTTVAIGIEPPPMRQPGIACRVRFVAS